MALERYLAMTAAEYAGAQALPEKLAWMACHFSPYGLGLSNLPRDLPEGSVIIVNDLTPVSGHSAGVILEQLQALCGQFSPKGVLLDLQRPVNEPTKKIVDALVDGLFCPVAVTEAYAKNRDCPVFLAPPPLYKPLKDHIAPWGDRPIWLEAAPGNQIVTVSEKGCTPGPLMPVEEGDFPHEDPTLHCRYRIEPEENQVRFILNRDADHLNSFLEEAASLGISTAIGLYQELKNIRSL